MSREQLLLHSGYRLRVGELMTSIALADNFTLGDLCQMLRDCHDMDLATLAALLQCPLEPFYGRMPAARCRCQHCQV